MPLLHESSPDICLQRCFLSNCDSVLELDSQWPILYREMRRADPDSYERSCAFQPVYPTPFPPWSTVNIGFKSLAAGMLICICSRRCLSAAYHNWSVSPALPGSAGGRTYRLVVKFLILKACHVCHRTFPSFSAVCFELSQGFRCGRGCSLCLRTCRNTGKGASDCEGTLPATCLFEQAAGLVGGIIRVECGAVWVTLWDRIHKLRLKGRWHFIYLSPNLPLPEFHPWPVWVGDSCNWDWGLILAGRTAAGRSGLFGFSQLCSVERVDPGIRSGVGYYFS